MIPKIVITFREVEDTPFLVLPRAMPPVQSIPTLPHPVVESDAESVFSVIPPFLATLRAGRSELSLRRTSQPTRSSMLLTPPTSPFKMQWTRSTETFALAGFDKLVPEPLTDTLPTVRHDVPPIHWLPIDALHLI